MGKRRKAQGENPENGDFALGVRFGAGDTALFATVTTAASCGAVNGMHDSFTPLGGLGLMLGDINATNAGIWERIVQDLLALSRTTVITVVTEREALRVDHWCRDVGRKSEVFENPRHPFLDRWVCSAEPRR